MSPRKKTRVKSAARADRMKAKWNDPTIGADGLTYRQRMAKQAKDQREREKKSPAPTPAAGPPAGDPEQKLPSAKTDPPAPVPTPRKKKSKPRRAPKPSPSSPEPTASKTIARSYTPGRSYR